MCVVSRILPFAFFGLQIYTNSWMGEQYLRWLWRPELCCPAAVCCTQPVCAACLAPAPSPGHCRICQQASGSARSSRSYQGLQQPKTQQRRENDEQDREKKIRLSALHTHTPFDWAVLQVTKTLSRSIWLQRTVHRCTSSLSCLTENNHTKNTSLY